MNSWYRPSAGLSVLPRGLKSASLIPGAVKYVEDVYAAARFTVINQVLSRGKALHTRSDVACAPAGIRMLSEQPETLGDLVNYAVCCLRARPIGPIHEYLVQIAR